LAVQADPDPGRRPICPDELCPLGTTLLAVHIGRRCRS
jgi:hypothetical protein